MTLAVSSSTFSDAVYTEIDNIKSKIYEQKQPLTERLFSIARTCITPLWTACGSWMTTLTTCNQSDILPNQKIARVAKTALVSLALLGPALGGLAVGQAIHSVAYALRTQDYTYRKGELETLSSSSTVKIFQQNVCFPSGEVAKQVGGMYLDDQERLEKIATTITEEKSHILCLQEVSDRQIADQFYEKTKHIYAHFYFNIGPSWCVLKNNSGLFVASQYEIKDPQFISFNGIPGIESMVNKGCFIFKTASAQFCHFHLSPTKEDSWEQTDARMIAANECRKKELDLILGRSDSNQPTLYLGDWNQSSVRFTEAFLEKLSGKPTAYDPEKPTCYTDRLKAANRDGQPREEIDKQPEYAFDYAVTRHFNSTGTVRQLPLYKTDQEKEAPTDHTAVVYEFKI